MTFIQVESSESSPEISATLRAANGRHLLKRQSRQRRTQHRQQREVLQWIVEQPQQAEQVADLQTFKKSPARNHQRHAEFIECLGVALGLAARRAQEDRHVAPIHRPESVLVPVPDLKCLPLQLAHPRGHQPRLLLRSGKVGRIIRLRAVIRFGFIAPGQTEVKLHARFPCIRGKIFSLFRRAELQSLLRVVIHAPDLLSHQPGEQPVDEIQNRLVTAKIIAQRDDLYPTFAPLVSVALKDARIGEAKPIDALFHVANQKPVCLPAFAPERTENRVLRLVNILVLVHEHQIQLFAPESGAGRRLVRRAVPEHLKRELLEVVKVQRGQLAFCAGELPAELPREFKQSGHLRPHPFPVLHQRVVAVAVRCQRVEKCGFVEEFFDRAPERPLFPAGPLFVCFEDSGEDSGDRLSRRVTRKAAQGLRATLCVRVVFRLIPQNRQPKLHPRDKPFTQPLLPPFRARRPERRFLFAEPALRVAQRLCIIVDAQHQLADRLVPAATVFEDQLLHCLGFGRPSRVMLFQQTIQRFPGEQTRLCLGQNGQLRVQSQLVKMLADDLQAKAVQCRDARRIDQRRLLGQPTVVRIRGRPLLQFFAEPLPYLRGGGFGKGHHQHVVERHGIRLATHTRQAALDQRARLAGAGPGDDQHISAGADGALLMGSR